MGNSLLVSGRLKVNFSHGKVPLNPGPIRATSVVAKCCWAVHLIGWFRCRMFVISGFSKGS